MHPIPTEDDILDAAAAIVVGDGADALGYARIARHLDATFVDEIRGERLAGRLARGSPGRRLVRQLEPQRRPHVVDRDLRVHGVGNLFLASSSVFPTSAEANPTFFAAVLAVRLAHHLAGARDESVLFETWYDGLATTQGSPERRAWWSDILAIRAGASRLLEGMRASGGIGASLQAEVTLYADAAMRARFGDVADELRFFFITSKLDCADIAQRPADAEIVKLDGGEVAIAARASEAAKCIRCWHYRDDVGTHPEHPEICGRCVENVDGGGETRRWF